MTYNECELTHEMLLLFEKYAEGFNDPYLELNHETGRFVMFGWKYQPGKDPEFELCTLKEWDTYDEICEDVRVLQEEESEQEQSNV